MAQTYDCEPTLNDAQVLEFCKRGYLLLEGVVPDEVNRHTIEFMDADPSIMPSEVLLEDWFREGVIENSQAAGAVRSLLGTDFGLPVMMANHRVECPMPAQEWHYDGGSKFGPELNYLQVFYYPQDCPVEMGPTELLPGSHFLSTLRTYMGHYGRIRGSYLAAAPAGSIFITVYSIWHRRSQSTAVGLRNNLKYNYWRTAPPRRDWIIEPDFDMATADYRIGDFMSLERPTYRQQFKDCFDSAEMFLWLCGKSDAFRLMGGQAWPMPSANRVGRPYGVPAGLAVE